MAHSKKRHQRSLQYALIGFRYPVRIRCELKEVMTDAEWQCAMQEMTASLNALAHAAQCSARDFLENPKYKLDVEKYKNLDYENN